MGAATATSDERRLRGGVFVALDMLRFSGRALLALRGVWRHAAEVLRQVSILVAGTTLITLFLMVTIGGVCGTFGAYALRSIGASDYVGLQTSLCAMRGSVIVMIGYVLAAKVGCGLVAEIGSMRIHDELDAFASVGLDPMRFVVGTRLMAMILFVPLLYVVSQLVVNLGIFLSVVVMVGETSRGAWESVHWTLQSPLDLLYGLIQCCSIALAIVLVATYYGYTVVGGPAEVGAATARSMIVNLVLVHAIYGVLALVFYGSDPRLPIGG